MDGWLGGLQYALSCFAHCVSVGVHLSIMTMFIKARTMRRQTADMSGVGRWRRHVCCCCLSFNMFSRSAWLEWPVEESSSSKPSGSIRGR